MNALIYRDAYSRMSSAWAHVSKGIVYRDPYYKIAPPNEPDYAIGHIDRDGIIYDTPYHESSVSRSTGTTAVGRVDDKGIIYSDPYSNSMRFAVAHVRGGYIYSDPHSEMHCAVGQYDGDARAAAAAWYLMQRYEANPDSAPASSYDRYDYGNRGRSSASYSSPDPDMARYQREMDTAFRLKQTEKESYESEMAHRRRYNSLSVEEQLKYDQNELKDDQHTLFVCILILLLSVAVFFLAPWLSDQSVLFDTFWFVVLRVLSIAGIVVFGGSSLITLCSVINGYRALNEKRRTKKKTRK